MESIESKPKVIRSIVPCLEDLEELGLVDLNLPTTHMSAEICCTSDSSGSSNNSGDNNGSDTGDHKSFPSFSINNSSVGTSMSDTQRDDKLPARDRFGKTQLHYVKDGKEARTFVEAWKEDCWTSIVLTPSNVKRTALHTAVICGNTDVVEYLTSLDVPNDKLVLYQDQWNRTALHYSKNQTISKLLVQSLNPAMQTSFLFMADNEQCTALHRAAMNRVPRAKV